MGDHKFQIVDLVTDSNTNVDSFNLERNIDLNKMKIFVNFLCIIYILETKKNLK